ncbi:uncharacterized protein LOC133186291 [Saccostrea echinata]|uniref:uncharacterized protein LOC133186291 n=1 Tax=Saccostrea echinata TaxID=191078 RepID=UPI002A7EC66A|nr:uncharacterized protein LOC133186291 [Saccostrea echinata]
MSYKGFGYVVDSCPLSKENTTEAATRLNCSVDEHGRSQYVCVPNENLTAIVEFCYTKSIVGLYQDGHCLKTIRDGFLDQISCKNFTEGCPAEHYRSTDLYKYPACSHLNTEDRCFLADPSCNSYSNTSKAAIDDGSVNVGVILGVVISILVLMGILVIAFFSWRRWQKLKRHNVYKNYSEVWIGDYSVWKTEISDQFFTLTDNEVSMLYCFLCSDSGPPDFTHTEWLDMLNKIRQEVYDKENPVTSEEAQQTLDRLKSLDFLWGDQDKITKNTKDETMYRIASIDGDILFWYSSYDTASVYLRSRRYNRKPGEKCVCGAGNYDSLLSTAYSDTLLITAYSDYFLIQRLQMNILTHVTMEDTSIYDWIYQILMVPMDVLKGNTNKRKKYLKKLKQRGESVSYRGRSQDSVQHVTWLWRYGYMARPDIVRSCIGLHQHWDIYIVDNRAYRKPSQYHTYPPDIRCFLYCLLLVDDYTLDINEQTHKTLFKEMRERYYTDLPSSDEINLTDNRITEGIIDRKGSVIKFNSTEIRHDVMYAFLTECLMEECDLEFYLTTASTCVVSEYCRSSDYKRSEGERCLYLPKWPEKMYDFFIDKLQLDIITHCTMSDEGIHDSISKRLNIPEEVLRWDIDARKRFVKNSKQESVKMFRARGMIVGCAGAGKTTLLRKLQGRKKTDVDKQTETTIGLEVHEDLFVIEDNKLIDFSTRKANSENQYLDNNVVSMTDFAGQVAYYACHQVYLSRRAFYIVVIDMSKKLDEESRMYDTDRHDPTGSLFHSWTYGDYFHFWLQTINTYCNEGIIQGNPKDTTAIKDAKENINFHPVILIASHKDQLFHSPDVGLSVNNLIHH